MVLLLLALAQAPEPPPVVLVRAPQEELQPQVEVDGDGIAHLLTVAGGVEDGALRYRTSEDGGDTWAPPLHVAEHVLARERVQGGRMALGRDGWVHVAWTGSTYESRLSYTRLGFEQEAFEAPRPVVDDPGDIEGGCAIAADGSGNVWVVWHAGGDERRRVLWIARSTDDGASFAPEHALWGEPTGACSTCKPAIATDGDALYVLYRGAGEENEHGTWLLVSYDGGATFAGRALDSWKTELCPGSSAALRPGPLGMVGVWERAGALSIASFRGLESLETDRKFRNVAFGSWPVRTVQAEIQHPALALDGWGDLLVVALSDIRWGREPRLDWTFYDDQGQRLGDAPHAREFVPDHTRATAFARTDGTFVVMY